MKKIFGAPSPALVIALIALFVALGGTSYAAVMSVPRNSVGTPQLKNNAVTGTKLAKSITLAPGHTEKGSFAFGASGAPEIFGGISYPIPLAADPTVLIIQAGKPTPAGCTGNVANPGAAPKHLCIFEGYDEGGVALINDYYSGIDGSLHGLTLGVTIYAEGGGSGHNDASGTWAVTG